MTDDGGGPEAERNDVAPTDGDERSAATGVGVGGGAVVGVVAVAVLFGWSGRPFDLALASGPLPVAVRDVGVVRPLSVVSGTALVVALLAGASVSGRADGRSSDDRSDLAVGMLIVPALLTGLAAVAAGLFAVGHYALAGEALVATGLLLALAGLAAVLVRAPAAASVLLTVVFLPLAVPSFVGVYAGSAARELMGSSPR